MKFQTVSPETAGISSSGILAFLSDLEQKHVPLHSFLLLKEDMLLAEGYFAPYKKDTPHRMFSISKSLTALAVGVLADEGRLSLSDRVADYFPDKVPADVHPWIAELTIKNLLMMRTCHASTTYKLAAGDWVESFFTVPPTHRGGTVFHYDTSAAHVLAALVERLTGKKLLDFIKERFAALELSEESYMLADPDGVSMGGSGLVATPMDVLKLGYLLLHGGNIDGTQFISASYIREATSCLTETLVTAPLPSEACGYGYMIWKTEKGGFVLYGMGGQLVMGFPKERLIFVTTADTQGIAGGNQLIYDAFYKNIYEPLLHTASKEAMPADRAGDGRAVGGGVGNVREGDDAYRLLQKKLSHLSIAPLTCFDNAKAFSLTSPVAAQVSHVTYHVRGENVSVFKNFTFDFDCADEGTLHFAIDGREYALSFGFGRLSEGIFPIYDLNYAASAVWLDAHTLYVRFHIIDAYVGSVHMQFYFGLRDLTVFMKKIEESCFNEFNGHFYAERTNL